MRKSALPVEARQNGSEANRFQLCMCNKLNPDERCATRSSSSRNIRGMQGPGTYCLRNASNLTPSLPNSNERGRHSTAADMNRRLLCLRSADSRIKAALCIDSSQHIFPLFLNFPSIQSFPSIAAKHTIQLPHKHVSRSSVSRAHCIPQ